MDELDLIKIESMKPEDKLEAQFDMNEDNDDVGLELNENETPFRNRAQTQPTFNLASSQQIKN